MRKISLILVVLVGFLMGFSTIFTEKAKVKLKPINTGTPQRPLTFDEYQYQNFSIPFVGKSFVGFKEALGFKESQGFYHTINHYGYMGKYQFGSGTLRLLSIDATNYLSNPELQEKSFLALCQFNKWVLRKDIRRTLGKKIGGVYITESGILAAAHLAGAGNVKRFLRSNGKHQFKDAFGSSLKFYLKKFSGYDTQFIEANKFPKVVI